MFHNANVVGTLEDSLFGEDRGDPVPAARILIVSDVQHAAHGGFLGLDEELADAAFNGNLERVRELLVSDRKWASMEKALPSRGRRSIKEKPATLPAA